MPRLRLSKEKVLGIGVIAAVGSGMLVSGLTMNMLVSSGLNIRKDDTTAKVCRVLRDTGIFPYPWPDSPDSPDSDVESVASQCKEENIELERSRIATAVVKAAARGQKVNASLLEDSAAEIIAVLQKAGHCEPLYEHSPPVCIEAAKILGLARNGEPVPRELLNALLAEIPTEKRGFTDIIQ